MPGKANVNAFYDPENANVNTKAKLYTYVNAFRNKLTKITPQGQNTYYDAMDVNTNGSQLRDRLKRQRGRLQESNTLYGGKANADANVNTNAFYDALSRSTQVDIPYHRDPIYNVNDGQVNTYYNSQDEPNTTGSQLNAALARQRGRMQQNTTQNPRNLRPQTAKLQKVNVRVPSIPIVSVFPNSPMSSTSNTSSTSSSPSFKRTSRPASESGKSTNSLSSAESCRSYPYAKHAYDPHVYKFIAYLKAPAGTNAKNGRNVSIRSSISTHASLAPLKLPNFPGSESRISLPGAGEYLLVTVKTISKLGPNIVDCLNRDLNHALISWLQGIQNSNVLRWLNLHRTGVRYLSESAADGANGANSE